MFEIFIITFLLSILLNFLIQKYFIKTNKFDEINVRSSHKVLATRSGGSAIFLSIFIITVFFYFNFNEVFDFSLIIPLSLLYTVGLYDDLYKIDFKLKFIFQIIVAKILIDQGFIFDPLNLQLLDFELSYFLSQIITIFFILLIINATNFSDGIDGLAITEAIKCLLIVILFNKYAIYDGINLFFSIIIIILIPLYYFNFKNKFKVFLGDSGSLLLGGIISIAIINFSKNSTFSSLQSDILMPLICFTYPIVDCFYVVVKRIINKKSPFIADKSHLHHYLTKNGLSHLKALILICGSFGLIQLILFFYITSLR